MDFDLISHLANIPGWNTKNAYEMTKLCCHELALRGMPIGGWPEIRKFIGKGSGTDINRGINDFYKEQTLTIQKQAQMLEELKGFNNDVLDGLAPHILGFWKCAVDFVRNENVGKELERDEEMNRLKATISTLVSEQDQLKESAVTLDRTINNLTEINAELSDQIRKEQLKHEITERQLEEANKELAIQRNTLRDELERSQKELSSALKRLEATGDHALLEVERVRADYEERIKGKEAAIQDALHRQKVGVERSSQLITSLTAKNSAYEQEVAALKRQLSRAEQQVDTLMAGKSAKSKGQAKKGAAGGG